MSMLHLYIPTLRRKKKRTEQCNSDVMCNEIELNRVPVFECRVGLWRSPEKVYCFVHGLPRSSVFKRYDIELVSDTVIFVVFEGYD